MSDKDYTEKGIIRPDTLVELIADMGMMRSSLSHDINHAQLSDTDKERYLEWLSYTDRALDFLRALDSITGMSYTLDKK